ncbi:MAG TPA: hypothetical protein VF680_11960 [Allosphingosinicella sp.]
MSIIEVPCNFVGSFKVGDNLRYNCEILCSLVAKNDDGSLNKMIVLQAGAIIEAAIIQIIYRAQNFNKEGVPNIIEQDRLKIEEAKIDKFAVAIDVLRKYSVLDDLGAAVYEDLHLLRKFRNKIHIQEEIKVPDSPRDEVILFKKDRREWALELNRRTLQYLSQALARPPHIHDYVGPLSIPG